jgi:hypothetical protein
MTRTQKTTVVVVVILLILLLFLLMRRHHGHERYRSDNTTQTPPAPTTPAAALLNPPTRHHSPTAMEPVRPSTAAAVSVKPLAAGTTGPLIPPAPKMTIEIPAGQEGMHVDLIPRGITIERCYYTEEVVNPGTQFYFDVNGSGFDSSFYRSITVDADALDVEVRDLRLITANQIRGLMVVGDAATTQYIHPKIFIHGLPVFRAPEPFGVVRYGEVLDIHLTAIDDSGQWGKFRIVTNLDAGLYPKLHIEPTSTHLEVSNTKPQLPFYVDGSIEIAPGLASGSYGLRVLLGTHEIFRKHPLVDVVKPNIGRSGSIESIQATELAHRPGDILELNIEGSGFLATQASLFTAKIDGVDAPPANFTFVSAGKYTMNLQLPGTIPKGVYNITIRHKGSVVFQKKAAFAIVPPDWLSHVELTHTVAPGGAGQIQLMGRELSPTFLSTLHLVVDEPGLSLSPLRQINDRAFMADLRVGSGVAAGDYIIHVFTGAKELRLPRGNIIKITS